MRQRSLEERCYKQLYLPFVIYHNYFSTILIKVNEMSCVVLSDDKRKMLNVSLQLLQSEICCVFMFCVIKLNN